MVVADSSSIIHLVRTGNIKLLKTFFGEIKITKEILKEITEENKIGLSEIKKGLESWIIVKEIKIVDQEEFGGLEKGDIEVILLAEKDRDIILTNDLALITVAKTKNIDCWWLTTFVLKCLYKHIISKQEAKELLFDLVKSGLHLKIEVYAAIEREIESFNR